MDKVSNQLNNENIEGMKKIIEKVAEANRVIAKSSLRKIECFSKMIEVDNKSTNQKKF